MIKVRIIFFAALIVLSGVNRALGYELYFGSTHSHTSYSDGKGVPADAYDTARYKAKLDFWVVTDHYEQLDFAKSDQPNAPRKKEWDIMKETAAAKTEPGKFVALAGYEWFDQSKGHMNVLNTEALAPYGLTYTLDKMRKWVAEHPEALIGFNHPGDPKLPNRFEEFAYSPETASQTFYIGVNSQDDFKHYFRALDNGWRVGPVGEQDNHDTDWGLKNLFAGVYAESLTYDGLFEAFRAHRFYSTNDRAMKIWFEASGWPMGSVLPAENGLKLKIKAERVTGKGAKVRVYSNGGEIIKEWSGETKKFKVKLPVDNQGVPKWYVAAVQNDEGGYSISAPIWVGSKP